MQRRGSADTFLRAMVQHRNSERLKGLVDAKLGELRRTLDLKDTQGEQAALEVVKSGSGIMIMDQIRSASEDLVNVEQRLLDERTRAEVRIGIAAQVIFFSAIVLTLSLLFWAARMVRNYAASRDQAEKTLQEQMYEIDALNRDLEQRVEDAPHD